MNITSYISTTHLPELGSIYFALARAAVQISDELRVAPFNGNTNRTNVHGDEVTALDEFAHGCLVAHLRASNQCAAVVSEESDDVIEFSSGDFIVALDPLDGSKNAGVNVPSGTIFSIYRQGPQGFIRSVSDQVASGYFLYGPATLLVTTVGEGTHIFSRLTDGFVAIKMNVRVPASGKTYSINAGNKQKWTGSLQHWLDEQPRHGKSLRYVGSMVSDVHRTLLEGGIFVYPGETKKPEGKLRLLYEVAPMAMIIENAGGRATCDGYDIQGMSIANTHQRAPVALGSWNDVEQFNLCYPPRNSVKQ